MRDRKLRFARSEESLDRDVEKVDNKFERSENSAKRSKNMFERAENKFERENTISKMIEIQSKPDKSITKKPDKQFESNLNFTKKSDNKFERGNDSSQRVDDKSERSQNFAKKSENEFETESFEGKNLFEKNRSTTSKKVENRDAKNRPPEKRFDKNSRARTTSAFLLDFQRKVVDQRSENLSRRRNARQKSNGPMTRAKSLSQLRDSPQERRKPNLGKTISTTFEFVESDSAELLDSNPRLARRKDSVDYLDSNPRKETRL